MKPQTNLHVLSNCGSDIALERYKFRHNAILRLLFEWLQTVINDTYTVCVDLDTVPQNCRISEILYENVRPDLLLFNNSKIIILELNLTYRNNKFINRTNMLISKISCNQNSENIQLDYSHLKYQSSDSFLHSQIFVAFYPFRSHLKVLNPTSSTQF